MRPTSHLGPGIPFTRSLRVEWRKSIDTRAARWLLASVVAVSVIAAIVPIATPHSSAQDLSNYLAIMAIGVTLLLPVVSILTLTSEWSQRTVLTTFTQDPRRDRVLAAKLAVGLGLAAIGGLAGLAIASAGLQVSDALGRPVSWHIGSSELIGYAVFVLLSSLMGMAFGALLHNTAAAIAAYFAIPTLITLVAVPFASHPRLGRHRHHIRLDPARRMVRTHRPDPHLRRHLGRCSRSSSASPEPCAAMPTSPR